MKKRIIKILSVVLIISAGIFCLTACGHTHEYKEEIIKPTCTEQGYTIHRCDCGEEYIDSYVDALDHDFNNYVSDHNATCTQDGTKTSKCSRCEERNTTIDVGSKLGHNYGTPTYEWNGQKCTATRVCVNDSTHKETETVTGVYVKDTNATCTVCEKGHYKATFSNSAFAEQNTAKDSVDKGSPLNHDFNNYLSDNNAKCTEDGTKTSKCSRCKERNTIIDVGSKLGHNYGTPTYEWNGQKCTATRVCLNDSTHKETETVTGVYIKDTDATCIICEKGHYRATFTNSAFSEQNTERDSVNNGGPLNHDFNNYVSNNNATCTEDGTKTSKCSRCEERNTIIDVGSKLGHLFVNYISNNDWSCTQDGTKTAHCSRAGCNAVDTKTDIDSHHHIASNPVTENEVPATSTKGGSFQLVVYCSKCREEMSRTTVTTPSIGESGGTQTGGNTNWSSNELLKDIPYPTGCSCMSLDLHHTETESGIYYGWAGGIFNATSEISQSYINKIKTETKYRHDISTTVASFKAYDQSGNYMIAIGTAGGYLSILVYKLSPVSGGGTSHEQIHIHDYSYYTVEPTCTEIGYTVFYCSCGDSYIRFGYEPLGHITEVIKGYAPTCTEAGLTDGERCLACGKTIIEQEPISPLGHDDKDGICSHCYNPIEYKATFVADGDIVGILPFTILTESLSEPVIPKKNGHTACWEEYTLGKEDITINAVYTKCSYTITYELFGGKNDKDNPDSYEFGSTITLKKPTHNVGKTFGGWFTDSSFSISSAINTITSETFGDITLYAFWISYCVESAEGFTVDYDDVLPTLKMTVNYDVTQLDFKGKITVSKDCSWKIYADEYATSSYDMKVVPLSEGENVFYLIVFHPDGEYYTQYLIKVYRLHLYTCNFTSFGRIVESVNVIENQMLSAISDASEDGYTFDNWIIGGNPVVFPYKVTGNLELKAEYTPIEYSVKYELDGGTLTDGIYSFTILDLPLTLLSGLNKERYHFAGWYTTDNFAEGVAQTAIDTIGNKTYYAKWEYGSFGINYLIDSDFAVVLYYEGSDNHVAIPATYNGYPVTYISGLSFATNLNIYSVEIPETVTTIERYSFTECYHLIEVINNGSLDIRKGSSDYGDVGCYAINVKTSGSSDIVNKDGYLFYTADNKSYLFNYIGKDTKLTLPDNYNGENYEIYKYAFYNCNEITSISFGSGVTSIGENAFSGCDKLENIYYIGDVNNWVEIEGLSNLMRYGVSNKKLYINGEMLTNAEITTAKKVNAYAFYNTDSLQSITIGKDVESIGENAFGGCVNISRVTYLGTIENWCEIDFDNIRSNPLNSTCELYINGNLIEREINLTSISEISNYAFVNYSYITKVVIGQGVEVIGAYAFEYCSQLVNVETADTVTTVKAGTFASCSKLQNITLGVGITTISSDAFSGCPIENVVIPARAISSISKTKLKKITITTGSIGSSEFRDCSSLTSVTIGNSVTSIGNFAFEGCSSLTTVYWNATNCATAGSYNYPIFNGCTKLATVIIGDNVKTIPSDAFRGCSSLTSIEIPDSVTSIEQGAFSGCSSLESITIPFVGAKAGVTSQYPFGYIFGTSSYTGGTKTEQRYCGSSTSLITSSYYYIPSSLKSVTVTGGNILYGAFYNCSSLTSITIGNSVTIIGSHAFYYCRSLTSVTIPNSVTSVGDDAFNNCYSLTSVTIGNNVTSLGGYAFYGCSSLTSITIPNSVTSVGDDAFNRCSSLTSITIPNSVTSIGSYAFYYCSSLTSVTIPNSVTSIGNYVFAYCSSLKSVTIGNSVTSIGNFAFYDCSSLTSITIPNSVTSIGSSAFYDCSSLTSITFSDTTGWYRTTNSTNWQNKTGGTATNVTTPSTNATYFKSTYYNSYWYKL